MRWERWLRCQRWVPCSALLVPMPPANLRLVFQQPHRQSSAMHYRIHHPLPHITYVLIISRNRTPHPTSPHHTVPRPIQQGHDPKVEPGAALQVELELLCWKDSLPSFPTKEEIEAGRARREAEDRARMEENPPPGWDEKIASSGEERTKGNVMFAEGTRPETIRSKHGEGTQEHVISEQSRAEQSAAEHTAAQRRNDHLVMYTIFSNPTLST